MKDEKRKGHVRETRSKDETRIMKGGTGRLINGAGKETERRRRRKRRLDIIRSEDESKQERDEKIRANYGTKRRREAWTCSKHGGQSRHTLRRECREWLRSDGLYCKKLVQ